MNVFIVSQCDKRALVESRRILDQFAERRGDRSWQTAITQDGLTTLRRLLRKTARKNTAIACHWIRGMDRSELLWVVGDRQRFNDEGAVPTNATSKNVLRAQDQNDWHNGQLIQALTDLAGLLHDLGKATDAFQLRLQGKLEGKNLVRHEWVSLRLLEAFVGPDDDATWLARLATSAAAESAAWLTRLHKDDPNKPNPSPFASLAKAPLAQALAWLVVTHHRMPVLPYAERQRPSSYLDQALTLHLTAAWNEEAFLDKTRATAEEHRPFWQFKQGLPVSNKEWQHRAARAAKRLQPFAAAPASAGLMSNPFVLHLARLSLMLADHHYSSLQLGSDGQPAAGRVKVSNPSPLLANTRSDQKPNQTLDEHLIGVAQHGAEVARFLPQFEQHLPRLGKHRRLKARAEGARFLWQNKAFDLAASLRERSVSQGAFIVNMASTGCGKTLANARVMYALAEPSQGMRCAFAMGLRTLTLQTGRAFRELLGLDDEELAIQVGGAANRALFEHYERLAEQTGSASSQRLLEEEDGHVLFEGMHEQHPLLRRAVADPQVRKLLLAPLLVCTIDHLTPATESQRGGRQIAPMLRLLSGDLVLDEPDDFDLKDLPALTRLVHWAGLLGSRVLLSSATLPPAMIQGLFEAYRHGRSHYQANRGERLNLALAPCCLWIDEFNQQHADCANPGDFEQVHQRFVAQRVQRLAQQATEPRRRLALIPLEGLSTDSSQAAQAFAALAMGSALELHQRHHTLDPASGKRVSFGLMRMANVEPLVEVALSLFRQGAPEGVQVHLCVYHSRFPLLIRSAIERQLDGTLKRHDPNAVLAIPSIRGRLEGSQAQDHLFIVLGSPVTEVGRDHDYDWAVVEPSSMRSLIQLLGRVRRHREGDCGSTNVHVFSSNLRHFTSPGKAAFCRPGFEAEDGPYRLSSHDLRQLLGTAELETLDARPRIQAPPSLDAQQRLSHLEHARMQDQMLPRTATPQSPLTGRHLRSANRAAGTTTTEPILNASSWWTCPPADALLTGLIPQAQRFRDDSGQDEVELVLLPDEDDGDSSRLHWVLDTRQGRRQAKSYMPVESLHTLLDEQFVQGSGIAPWGVSDYIAELSALAESLGLPLRRCAEKFGTVSVPKHERGWRSHPVLGFTKKR